MAIIALLADLGLTIIGYCWRIQIEVEQGAASEMRRPLRSAADEGC